MTGAHPDLRRLSPAEVAELVDWARLEGWNPGLDDARAFHATDPDGFIGAFLGGRMVAGIAAIAYDDAFGFIGLFIVRPEHRGLGLGRAVWQAGLARLGARTIGLDGVPAQQSYYRRMGFVDAYRTWRYGGRLRGGFPAAVAPVGEDDLGALSAYDQGGFPARRDGFLARWLAPPHHAVMARENGRVVGYGVARRCAEGAKVGPLFADRLDLALALAEALAARLEGTEILIDVPEPRRPFAVALTQRGLVPGFETARMYRGPALVPLPSIVHGITTLELG
jgi:GNAT superfamily N-acetyltransferase